MYYLNEARLKILRRLERENNWLPYTAEFIPDILYLMEHHLVESDPLQLRHDQMILHITEDGRKYMTAVHEVARVDRFGVDRLEDYLIDLSVRKNSVFRRVPILRVESLTDAFLTLQLIREDQNVFGFNYNLFSETSAPLLHTCEVGFWSQDTEADRVWSCTRRSPSWAIFAALVKCFLEVRF